MLELIWSFFIWGEWSKYVYCYLWMRSFAFWTRNLERWLCHLKWKINLKPVTKKVCVWLEDRLKKRQNRLPEIVIPVTLSILWFKGFIWLERNYQETCRISGLLLKFECTPLHCQIPDILQQSYAHHYGSLPALDFLRIQWKMTHQLREVVDMYWSLYQ